MRAHAAPWMRTVLPSAAQVPLWWDDPPPTARVVPNGVDLDLFAFRPRGGAHAVWAGRLAPNKAPHLAAAAARAAGIALDLHGHVEDCAYFDAEVAPLLGARIRHLGHASRAALAAALGAAGAALFTPMWEEPFGLAAAEALACGTPVAAFPVTGPKDILAGAVRPVGAVTADLRAAALRALDANRGECRAYAERFSWQACAEMFLNNLVPIHGPR